MAISEIITQPHPLVLTLLTDRNVAIHAWDQWSSMNDLDRILYSELIVLPMVYQRWKDDRIFVFDERIKGIARKFLYQNTLYQHASKELCELLPEHRIPFRQLCDVLIQQAKSQSRFASHVTQSIDLWIPVSSVTEALQIISSQGWKHEHSSRLRASFRHANGLHLNIHHRLSRHWDTVRHDRFFQELDEPDSKDISCTIDILLSKYSHGNLIDLQSVIDLCLLLQGFSDLQIETLATRCKFYLLSNRLHNAMQLASNFIGNAVGSQLRSDSLENLQILFSQWLQSRSMWDKVAYHKLRHRLLTIEEDQSVLSFYRYWRMQRNENKQIHAWINSLRSIFPHT